MGRHHFHCFVEPHEPFTPPKKWHPSWPLRIALARGTSDEPGALCSVADEAEERGDRDWHDAAELALSGDWSELNALLNPTPEPLDEVEAGWAREDRRAGYGEWLNDIREGR